MVKDDVLRALEQARGTRISGGQLAAALGVSRTAVWKAVDALREDGLQIDSLPGGGYCLADADDSLTAPGIAALLHTKRLGQELLVLPEVDSTNTRIKREFTSRAEGFTLVAEAQTAGRGRLGRVFASPPRSGIYLSTLLHPHLPITRINLITLAAATAVCRMIERTADFAPEIKWVNDVLKDGKKLCGILTEAAVEGESGMVSYVVVGIGVNLRFDPAVCPDLAEIAGGLSDFCEKTPRRAEVAAVLIEELDRVYDLLCTDRADELLNEYRSHLGCLDQPITVYESGRSWEAICTGLNDDGHLIVRNADGETKTLFSGEISIRTAAQKHAPQKNK